MKKNNRFKLGGVLLWSGESAKLVKWYKETLDLEVIEELDHPQDTGTLFRLGENYLWIGQHSKVQGNNRDKYRHMFNIEVHSVTQVYNDLLARDVSFIAAPFPSPTDPNLYFATFEDCENNLIQLVGDK